MELAAVKPAACFPWKAEIPAGPVPRTLTFYGKNVEARMVVKKKKRYKSHFSSYCDTSLIEKNYIKTKQTESTNNNEVTEVYLWFGLYHQTGTSQFP